MEGEEAMIKKNILIPITYSGLFFITYLITCKELNGTELIFRLSFGYVGNHKAFIGEAFFHYLLIVFSHILFGNRLFKNFCNATAYFYIRTVNLKRWFMEEIIQLFIDIVKFYFINILSLLSLCLLSGKLNKFEFSDILFILYFIMVYSLFTFITSIAINIISIYADSGMAFTIVEGINTIFIGFYLITGDIYTEEYLINNPYIFKYNPICHLMIGLHKSNLISMNKYLTTPKLQINLSTSILFLLLFTILFIVAGCFFINKKDLMGDKMEGE